MKIAIIHSTNNKKNHENKVSSQLKTLLTGHSIVSMRLKSGELTPDQIGELASCDRILLLGHKASRQVPTINANTQSLIFLYKNANKHDACDTNYTVTRYSRSQKQELKLENQPAILENPSQKPDIESASAAILKALLTRYKTRQHPAPLKPMAKEPRSPAKPPQAMTLYMRMLGMLPSAPAGAGILTGLFVSSYAWMFISQGWDYKDPPLSTTAMLFSAGLLCGYTTREFILEAEQQNRRRPAA